MRFLIIGGITFCNVALYIGITALSTPTSRVLLLFCFLSCWSRGYQGHLGAAVLQPTALGGYLSSSSPRCCCSCNLSPFIRQFLFLVLTLALLLLVLPLAAAWVLGIFIIVVHHSLSSSCGHHRYSYRLLVSFFGGLLVRASLQVQLLWGTATTTPAAVACLSNVYSFRLLQRKRSACSCGSYYCTGSSSITGWLDKKLANKNNTAEAQAPEEGTCYWVPSRQIGTASPFLMSKKRGGSSYAGWHIPYVRRLAF